MRSCGDAIRDAMLLLDLRQRGRAKFWGMVGGHVRGANVDNGQAGDGKAGEREVLFPPSFFPPHTLLAATPTPPFTHKN